MIMTETKDDRIVYGAVNCVWWDEIANAGSKPGGLPCCPHCGCVLMEMPRSQWDESVKRYEDSGHPNYSEFVVWLKGKCFPSISKAMEEYERV